MNDNHSKDDDGQYLKDKKESLYPSLLFSMSVCVHVRERGAGVLDNISMNIKSCLI